MARGERPIICRNGMPRKRREVNIYQRVRHIAEICEKISISRQKSHQKYENEEEAWHIIFSTIDLGYDSGGCEVKGSRKHYGTMRERGMRGK